MKCDKNPIKIQSMFNEIANYYDSTNNLISFGMHYIIKFISVHSLKIPKRANILDLCCGTGDFTKIISKTNPKARVLGLDFSLEMLKLAQQKNPHKAFLMADCTNLPFKDCEFDFVTMGFGLRNIENRQLAESEIFRVLKPGGRFLQLDFGYHNKIGRIFNIFVPLYVKFLKRNSAHYTYLLDSKETFPEPHELVKEFEVEGFKFVKEQSFLFGAISYQIMEKP